MREFLKGLVKEKNMEVLVPQHQFRIQLKNFEIKPREFKKLYSNKNLMTKRIFDPKRSLSKTWPIGTTSFD